MEPEMNTPWPVRRLFITSIPSIPEQGDLAHRSYRITEEDQLVVRRVWLLANGSPVSFSEDTNSDGLMDYFFSFYDEGLWMGEIDLNGDGKTDAREFWRDGELKSIAFDINGNTKYEHVHLFAKSGDNTYQWDFDEDGSVDYEMPSGSEHRIRGVESMLDRIMGDRE
jgi:hypothetical protein